MLKSPLIKLMEDAVLKAGKSLARDFGEVENLQVSRKGPGDFVTSADLRSEEILMRELKKARPGFGFLIEESGEVIGSDTSHRWIIDPLDGTANFMHGIPHFCISVGLEKREAKGKSEIIAGVIFAPALGELFWAEKGIGAYSNHRRLAVSSRSKMDEALVATYIGRGMADYSRLDKANRAMAMQNINVRALGSAALEMAYVAAGKLDAFWHQNLKPWDVAAGLVIIREARGIVSEITGGERMMETGDVLATNANLHDSIKDILKQFYT